MQSELIAVDRSKLGLIAAGLAAGLPEAAVPPADLDRRRWIRLVATDHYDAWLIHWPSGGGVAPHDHGGSSGAFAIAHGSLVEYVLSDGADTGATFHEGAVGLIDPTTVHDVVNVSGAPAASVHVYSPPLTHMSFYDASELGDLRELRVEVVDPERTAWSFDALSFDALSVDELAVDELGLADA